MTDSIATIIGAAITGLLSLIVFILSSLIPKITANKTARQKIYVRQLKKLFEPIVRIMEENNADEFSEKLLIPINEKILANISLAPVELLSAYHNLVNNPIDVSEATYVFKDVVYSNFNWIKKNLSYPYDSNRITCDCLGEHGRLKLINNTVKISALIVMGIVAFTLLLAVMYVLLGEKRSSAIMEIFKWCTFGFGGIFFISIIASSEITRKKGTLYKKLKKEEEKRRQKSQNEKRPYKVFGLFVRCKAKEKLCQGQDEDGHQKEKKPPEMCEK